MMASADAIRAGGAVVEIGGDTNPIEATLRSLQGKLKTAGKWIAGVGATVLGVGASIGGMGATITAPFIIGAETLADLSGQITATSRMTGMSMSEVQDAAAGLRIGLDELPAAVAKMSSFLFEARNPASQAADEINRLGLSVEELQGMTQNQRLLAFADALSKVSDEGERIALQRQIFGRAGLNLNISGGAAGVLARAARKRELGAFVSDEDAKAGRELAKAQKEIADLWLGISLALGAVAVPVLKEIAEVTIAIILPVSQWIRENRELLGIIFRIGLVLGAVGTVIGTVGAAIVAVGIGFVFAASAIGIVAGLIFNPISLAIIAAVAGALIFVAASVALAAGAMYAMGFTISDLIHYYRDLFKTISNTSAFTDLSTAFDGIRASIATGDWGGAFSIGWTAVKLLFETGVNDVIDIWYNMVFELQSGWRTIVAFLAPTLLPALEAVVNAFYGMLQGIQQVLNFAIGEINNAIASLPEAVRNQLGLGPLAFIDLVDDREAAINRLRAGVGVVGGGAPERGAADRNIEDQLRADLEHASLMAEAERQRLQDERDNIDLRVAERSTMLPELARGGSFGSFSARALEGIGVLSAADRTAVAVEAALDVQRDQLRRLDDIAEGEGGIVAR